MRASFAAAALYLAFLPCLRSQDRPGKQCAFDGFSSDPKLAQVTAKSTTAYVGCSTARDCRPVKLSARDAVVVYSVEAGWTCGYLSQRSGAGPGWVRTEDTASVLADAHPPLDSWAGIWANGDGRIQIQGGKGRLVLHGNAVWHGRGDVVHTGSFEGEAVPAENHVHFVEDGPDSCTIDLTLIGGHLVANDNDHCGGMNVRFWGVWKRAAK